MKKLCAAQQASRINFDGRAFGQVKVCEAIKNKYTINIQEMNLYLHSTIIWTFTVKKSETTQHVGDQFSS